MKKSLIVIAAVSLAVLMALAGCRAVQRAPGATAIQSAVQSIVPTLPVATPSPLGSPAIQSPMGTVGASVAP